MILDQDSYASSAHAGNKNRNGKRSPTKTSDRVLAWIQRYIEAKGIRAGGSLPGEIEMARAAGAGRSSVREALTALKALGIVTSRKKGGIRVVRDPVLLEIRDYLTERYQSRRRFKDALEFRAVMEWGLGELTFEKISAREIQTLYKIVEEMRKGSQTTSDLYAAEKMFHTVLTKASRNHLAALLGHLYTPIFDTLTARKADSGYRAGRWIKEHFDLIQALERKDRRQFLTLLQRHVRTYWRAPSGLSAMK